MPEGAGLRPSLAGPAGSAAWDGARIVAMAAAHCAGATPHEIAQAFGRDHSTVHHAVRRARSDDNLAGAVTAILSATFAGKTVRTL